MNLPDIDVLLPVRQGRASLPAAVDDVLAQTHTALRLLAVVDLGPDGADDGSRAWLEQRAASEPRLVVIPGVGRGAAAALQLGLDAVMAPFVSHMEADDRCPPGRLGALLDAIRGSMPPLDGVCSRVEALGPLSEGMRRYLDWQNGLLSHEQMSAERFLEIPALHQTGLYRTDALVDIGGYLTRGPWPLDIDFWFRWFEAGLRVAKLPEALYGWTQHPEQSTRSGGLHGRAALHAAKCDALVRHLRGRGLVGEALQLVGRGRSLKRWQRSLAEHGLRAARVDAWELGQLPPALPEEGLLVAVVGMEPERRVLRARLGHPPEPERLLFTA